MVFYGDLSSFKKFVGKYSILGLNLLRSEIRGGEGDVRGLGSWSFVFKDFEEGLKKELLM